MHPRPQRRVFPRAGSGADCFEDLPPPLSQRVQENPAIPSSTTPPGETEDILKEYVRKNEELIPNSVEYQSKIWPEYLREADQHDRAMAYDAKTDMDSVLIFAGLFTAALTPFTLESYKLLKRDSGDMTMILLAQISEQLRTAQGVPSNSSSSHLLTTSDINSKYHSPLRAIICNLLFFTALGLSLAAALMAVMIQRWSQLYVRATENRSRPFERARVREYLYRGLKKFGIQSFQELVPILLEFSVFSFYAGLVLFLYPISNIMGLHSIAIVFISAFTYAIFTFLPIIYSDCPFETPLTKLFWFILQIVHGRFQWARYRLSYLNLKRMLAERREEDAVADTPERKERDANVLAQTIELLYTSEKLVQWLQTIYSPIHAYQAFRAGRLHMSWEAKLFLHLLDDEKAQLGQKLRDILDRSIKYHLPGEREQHTKEALDVITSLSWLREDNKIGRPKILLGIETVFLISQIPPVEALRSHSLTAAVQVFYATVEYIIDFNKFFRDHLLNLHCSFTMDRLAHDQIAKEILSDKTFTKRCQSVAVELAAGKRVLDKWNDQWPNGWPWETMKNRLQAYLPLCESFLNDGLEAVRKAAAETHPNRNSLFFVEAALEKGERALEELFDTRVYTIIDHWHPEGGSADFFYHPEVRWREDMLDGRVDEFGEDPVSPEAQKVLLSTMLKTCSTRLIGAVKNEGRSSMDRLWATAHKLGQSVVTDSTVVDDAIRQARVHQARYKNKALEAFLDMKKDIDARAGVSFTPPPSEAPLGSQANMNVVTRTVPEIAALATPRCQDGHSLKKRF